jgi:hypothetical protein
MILSGFFHSFGIDSETPGSEGMGGEPYQDNPICSDFFSKSETDTYFAITGK